MAMATSISNDDAERDLTCAGVCMEYYDDGVRTPKLLECGHVFCSSCLKELEVRAIIGVIACPLCRKETNIRKGVENLPTCIMTQVKLNAAKRKNIENENVADILSGLIKESTLKKHNMCYIQFKVCNTILPKIFILLDFNQAPKMSKRFMDYCTGSSCFSYKKCPIFMIKHGESFTAGRYEDLDIVEDEDGVAGPLHNGWCDGRTQRFIADHSTLNESKGALRMRHRGKTAEGVYICSEFSIICRDHPNNSQMTTVFGYVVRGIEIFESISRHNLHNNVSIHSCGVMLE